MDNCTSQQDSPQILVVLIVGSRLDFFPSYVSLHSDIMAKYHLFQSFRRASGSRAIAKGLNLSDIRIVNRWHKVEKAVGQQPSYDISRHYAQIDLLVDCFLRYAEAM